MEYIYSAMLLHSGGKPISEENISSVLKAAGIEPEASKVKALVAALEGVDIKVAIAQAAVAAAPGPAAAAPKEGGEKKEEKKKEEDKKVSEEDAVAGLGALFG